jgi:hypothetical protein
MKRFATVVSVLLLAACGQSDKPAPQAATPAPPPPPPPIDMNAVAGTWTFTTMPTGNDSVLVTYTVKATAADTGWTITFPNRKPMAMHIVIAGDSIMNSVGPYPSVLRKGVQVSTNGVLRLKDGKLSGLTMAHYSKGPDTVRTLRAEGTKKM